MDDLVVTIDHFYFSPIYSISVLCALVLIFLFPLTKGFTSEYEKIQYYYLQGITLIGAVFGSKVAVLMGDALWPIEPFAHWMALLWSGRSIVGALVFGFIFAEIAKPLMRYKRPPNDRFAVILPFSLAIGRIGCWFSGCCLGLPSESRWAFVHIDDIQRHPILLYEFTFQIMIGLLFIRLYRSGRCKGQIFALYMIFYGLFRFMTEFIRDTPKEFFGYSAYQYFAFILFVLGTISFIARSESNQARLNAAA